MFERFASTDLLVAAALAVPVASATFLVIVAFAALLRRRGREIGNGLGRVIGFTGGAALGALLLFSPSPTLAAPIVLASALSAASRWRAGRHAQAGSIVLGTALPIATGWAAVATVPGASLPTEVVAWL